LAACVGLKGLDLLTTGNLDASDTSEKIGGVIDQHLAK